jgi:hypothetical protein
MFLFCPSSLMIMLADDPSKQSILRTDSLEASMHLGGSRPGGSPKVFTFGLLVTSNPVLNLLFTAIFFEIWNRSISASSSARCSP